MPGDPRIPECARWVMPLILLGLIVLIGILLYAVYNYRRGSGDEMISDARRERERRSREASGPEEPEQRVLFFPTDNVEVEKRKRNID